MTSPNTPAERFVDLFTPKLVSVLREGSGFVPKADTVVEAGDEVLVVLDPGLEESITAQFVGENGRG